MIIVYIIIVLLVISGLIMWNDYLLRLKLSKKIKVVDYSQKMKSFDRVEVMEIYENEKRKRIAKCKYEDGTIVEYSCLDLIY